MFNGFFIMIGGIVLSILNFFKNVSFKEINLKPSNEISSSVFSKLNLELETPAASKHEDRIDKIRDKMLIYMSNRAIIAVIIAFIISLTFLTGIEISAMFLVIVLMIYIFLIYYPQMKEQRGYSDLNQELPYALRHMSIELKAGRGLHDALLTIRNANYGSLSREFNRVLEEVKFGKSTEDALLEMTRRVKSEGLSRSIHQIVGTLRVGGNLAGSLEIIAKDISFDMQIKLKEFSQKLNSFILIYTFIAILAPVISLIMLMAGSTVMGDIISSELLFVIYGVFFPLIVMFMGLFIKKLEPKI